ncbi:MAG: lytic transglycosylase domain-containing protein [Gammaproteobacteria bacterium]|nr:lytic transglycosylase domain-containing protein [Gammaproteobacteria bacterium]MDH4314751.1 lytic transglycosylase domain-containing protein [Gammaproteobacteria bacterium]MDH5212837.1 lytic transglycosylase domain-containing protein [Gammaproteobacteria bacterium]MDH5499519.1 lytic transglycosylase domain-containing protein [Gammaproteobacteria bacterium]
MRSWLAAFACAVTLTIASYSIAGPKTAIDPELAWKQYLRSDTDIKPSYRFPHAQCFRSASLAHNLPETLLLAVARGESDFDAMARSKANAHGVMQIQWPGTARHLGIFRLTELYDPCTNIEAGARYLNELLQQYGGNVHLALAAYNYGPGRIAKDGMDIPSGAEWYSGYILRHLDYVLGNRVRSNSGVEHLYSDLGRTTLVSFAEPYRAAAFVTSLEEQSPALQLDWFRHDVGSFTVVLRYADKDDFHKSAALLANVGFRLE